MRIAILAILLLAAVPAWAQPGPPGPLRPRRGETTTTAPTGAPQYVVGTVDDKSRVAQGLKSQGR